MSTSEIIDLMATFVAQLEEKADLAAVSSDRDGVLMNTYAAKVMNGLLYAIKGCADE